MVSHRHWYISVLRRRWEFSQDDSFVLPPVVFFWSPASHSGAGSLIFPLAFSWHMSCCHQSVTSVQHCRDMATLLAYCFDWLNKGSPSTFMLLLCAALHLRISASLGRFIGFVMGHQPPAPLVSELHGRFILLLLIADAPQFQIFLLSLRPCIIQAKLLQERQRRPKKLTNQLFSPLIKILKLRVIVYSTRS